MKRFSLILFVFLILVVMHVLRNKDSVMPVKAEDSTEVNSKKGESSIKTSGDLSKDIINEREMSQEEWEKKEKFEAMKTLFEIKCKKCHPIQNPLSKNKDRDGWKATVERMQKKDPAWILPAEVEKITKYLSEVRGITDDTTKQEINVEITPAKAPEKE